MNKLPIQRYQFTCQTEAPLTFNDYAGSMLRGAFGHALRAMACVTKMQDCSQCMLYRQCSYPTIFEPPPPLKSDFQAFNHIPSPYLIEPPVMGKKHLSQGEEFSFNLVLIGSRAMELFPFIIIAWKEALQKGLGKEQSKVQLTDIRYEPGQAVEQIIYRPSQGEFIIPDEFIPQTLQPVEQMNIRLLSPLRIQQQKRILSNDMLGKDFLMALVRRYYLLQEFYTPDYQAPDFSALSKQAEAIQAKPDFKWYQWTRYSSLQKQKMVLGGVIGAIELTGELSPFLDIINLGQWLHIGKNTTFGMGQYSIEK